jgi:DNA repair exonuclease SbcCD nuclease subunit
MMRIIATELHLIPRYSWMPFDRRNERRKEYLRVLGDLLEKSREERADAIVLPGDIFDGINPTYPVLIAFGRAVKELQSRGVDVIAVPGNHDRYKEEGRKGPLDLMAEITHMKLLHSDGVLRGEGIPYIHKQEDKKTLALYGVGFLPLMAGMDPMELLPSTPPSKADKHYLVTHYTFTGFSPPYTLNEPIAKYPPNWIDFVIAGHIHKRAWILGNRGIYTGLAERIGFEEENEEVGFALIDLPEGDVSYLNRESRPFRSVDISMPREGNLTDFLLRKMGDLSREIEKEAIVRLILRGKVPEDVRDTLNMRKVLEGANSMFFAVDIETKDLETDVIIYRPSEKLEPRSILMEIAEEQKKVRDPEKVEEAVKLILEVMEE